MITPLDEAPAPFMERYTHIKKGEEKINTAAKLKDFWLFAIEQGKNHREMREYIASLAISVETSPIVRGTIYSDPSCHYAYIGLESFAAIGNEGSSKREDEEHHDMLWQHLKEYIEAIDANRLDEYLETLKAVPQLDEIQAVKVVEHFKRARRSLD
jgi:hypothetical protein